MPTFVFRSLEEQAYEDLCSQYQAALRRRHEEEEFLLMVLGYVPAPDWPVPEGAWAVDVVTGEPV